MSDRHQITVISTALDIPDERIEKLKAIFLKSRYRNKIERTDAISYETSLTVICREIIMACRKDQPIRDQELFQKLTALRAAVVRFAMDDNHLNTLPVELREAVYQLIEIDPWKLSVPRKRRGRPKASTSANVARVVLNEYWRLYIKTKISHSSGGDFVNLLKEIFAVLELTKNPEHAARKAIGALEKNT